MFKEYAVIFLSLGVAMALQIFLTGAQTKRFMRRLRDLRKDGRTSIGKAGNIYKGKMFCVLVIDDENKIVHAEQLSGWTVFAKLKPVSGLIGYTLDELMDESKPLPVNKKILEAFRSAGSEFYKEDSKTVAQEPVIFDSSEFVEEVPEVQDAVNSPEDN